jgi:hypothetical protein
VIEAKISCNTVPAIVGGKMLHIIPLARLSVQEWDTIEEAQADRDFTLHWFGDEPAKESLVSVSVEELVKGLTDAQFSDVAGGCD